MGSYNLGNFKSYLTLALGNRDGLSTYLPIWVNSAYLGLCAINKIISYRRIKNLTFPELDTEKDNTTIDGQPYISRPSDCLMIHTIWDMTNDSKLTQRGWRWYIDQTGRANTNSEGEPDYWIPYGNRTYLLSTPDDAYNTRTYYRKRPVKLVNETDVTIIGEEWDEAILQSASQKGHLWLRDFQNADIWKKEFMESLERLVGMQTGEGLDLKDYWRPDPGYLDFSY